MIVLRFRFALLTLSLAVLAVATMAHAQPPPLLLGTAWYPEQWPESRWEADLALMEQANMHVVRVGEFAWSTLEPTEGHFDFGWLDRAIALAAQHHIAVVLGTPTAAPPAWMTSKYPDTLRVNEDGHREEHGNRQQFSFSSPRYRVFARRIAMEMAKRYGHNANVLGWQIDNELAASSFDESTRTDWHRWLTAKYKSIAELNRRWATAYWSETYDNFDQVPLHSRNENPGLLLDYKHFVTDEWTEYAENQIDAMRPLIESRQFITTNTMHWFNVYDHYEMHRKMDLAAWDDYSPDGKLDAVLNAASHDLVRGYKQKNFWLMETQPAFVNWGPVNAAFPPGVTREAAWQAIGHGADAVLYWQWRSALNGQEQYHGTLLGADGQPVPVYGEIAKLGEEMALAGPALAGTSPHAQVAILNDYSSHWAIDFQKHTQKFDYVEQITDLYRALQPVAQTIDIVSPLADLSGYKVVFAPALNVLPEATAQHLLEYVRSGGHLVLGARSGMKDADNGLDPRRQPGPLREALGAKVQQYYALDRPVGVRGPDGLAGSSTIWAEALSVDGPETRVLMRYVAEPGQRGWLDDQPAVVSHAAGKGSITYVGATLDAKLTRALTDQILSEGGVHPMLADLPDAVELNARDGAGKTVWILINHGAKSERIKLPSPMKNLLAPASSPSAEVDLAAHDVVVLERQ